MSGVAHRLRTVYRRLAKHYDAASNAELDLLPDEELHRIGNYVFPSPQETPSNETPARPYPSDGLTHDLNEVREMSPDLADRIVGRILAGGLESVLQRR